MTISMQLLVRRGLCLFLLSISLLLLLVDASAWVIPQHRRVEYRSALVDRSRWVAVPQGRHVRHEIAPWVRGMSLRAPTESTTEKLTPEAQELESILEARQKGDTKYRYLIAQTAPSVRVAFSELFGEPPGTFEPSILVSALKELGFTHVLDTNTAADLTICEEGTELLQRLVAREEQREKGPDSSKDEEPLPLFTSCCPGWMNMVEKSAPELIPYISSCKSPHMMYGAVVKRNSEELFGCAPDEIYLTSVMPCVKKRGESDRPVFVHGGVRDVDNVITTKDLGLLLRKHDIDPLELDRSTFDSPFQNRTDDRLISGLGTGAGQLFGATGGVMEASVRSVYEIITGMELPRLELEELRGFDGVREAIIPLFNKETGQGLQLDLRVAVVNGLGQAKKLIQRMKDGEVEYDFVEVMACPGGCIGGGGQPKPENEAALKERLEYIYSLDRSLPLRRSHENPTVKALYERVLGKEFGSEKAKDTLHVKPVYGGAILAENE